MSEKKVCAILVANRYNVKEEGDQMGINNKMGWKLYQSYTNLPERFFSTHTPTAVREPKLIVLNEALAKSLGLNESALQTDEGMAIFAGNEIPEGSTPLAQAYAGHQFGHLTMLGDGRAILLGEQRTPTGEQFDIQLKGSGKTPYSRGGDGRAALGPMLREYIISEAMYELGIPTTRSLAVVTTGEPVIREDFLTGAVLTRVAASHIRVGTFQYAAGLGNVNDLQALADYTIQRHYSDLWNSENRYLSFLEQVATRQAALIAKWQLVGFIHGVMNTDNMTISGETIDYGPCAFMDVYDPLTVFSSIDQQGRYAYRNQPPIAAWNLARFAETLLPLIHHDQDEAVKLAQAVITKFHHLYDEYWLDGMRAKLGIFNKEQDDLALIEDFLVLMKEHRADYTNTFLGLTFNQDENISLLKSEEFSNWKKRWEARLKKQSQSKEQSEQLMKASNPALIPRNHRVEEALEAAVDRGDLSVMNKLLHALANPYAHRPDQKEYAALPPESVLAYKTYCGT